MPDSEEVPMGDTSGNNEGLRTYRQAVAIVTGGGSGIGAALGRGLAARGAHVVLADRDEEAARAEAGRLTSGGAQAEATALDVREAADVERVVVRAFETHGRLDYLFNNAGVAVGGEALDLSLEDWRYAVEVNLMGPIHGVQAAYPRMVKQGFGHIVNTASMAAFMAAALVAPYGATKHAVYGLSRALRVEGADRGIRVSVLCPGVIRTPILEDGGRYGRVTVKMDRETQRALWDRLRPMPPNHFAAKALDAVARNRGLIVIPAWWRVLRLLGALFPSFGEALVVRELRRIRPLLQQASAGGPGRG
jgi:NAD(P)-dependent dehydrogenase (short-subunit alcohol dehydrogenase family)